MFKHLLQLIIPTTKFAKWLVFFILFAFIAAGFAGYFEPVKELLDTKQFTIKYGDIEITLYRVLKSILIIISIFWVTSIITGFAEERIKSFSRIKSGNRAIINKIVQIFIYFLAFMFILDFVGIDLTALTVLGGAIGIGIGFGLQKITSNFISGLILLFEKSVKIDDLVELNNNVSGFVRHIGARYTLVETFDSKEIMIPNEDFITNSVTNWTYSNTKGRIEIKIGVSYKSDIEKAQELILEAATEHPRCSKDPAAVCYLREFGDSSVNFLLFFWVDDVTQGRFQPQSEVLMSIWKKFAANNIEIPFPQRDMHVKNFNELAETLKPEKKRQPKK